MATIKIKFRLSTIDSRQGVIYYQVIHKRVARQRRTFYKLYADEWDSNLSEIIFPKFDENRKQYLSETSEKINNDICRFKKIIATLEQKKENYTADDIISAFALDAPSNYFFSFAEDTIVKLKKIGKIRISETYTSAINSFKCFQKQKDILLDDINSDMMVAYETYLHKRGIVPNSSSFYMRNLRALYNRAVDQELTTQRFPFKHVYTGVDKTIKRAVSLQIIKRIKELDLSMDSSLEYTRDLFLFSFYTRGMAFVDMAYLRKKDLNCGILSYRRRKTGQQLQIKWEKCMQEIVDKYKIAQSYYLLPIIKPYSEIEERKQYIYAAHNINHKLKIIGNKLNLPIPLTMYVSRHSWASIAKSKNVPISIISEGMGHDSETTTRIYLASLDNMAIDKVNRMIIKSL